MYSLIKSRRIEIDNMYQAPVMFCCFLNHQHLLIVYQSKIIDVVSTLKYKQERVIQSAEIESKYGLLDCKRIKENNCVVLSESNECFYHVQYKQGKLSAKQVQINVEMIQNLSGYSRLVSFINGTFVILHQVYLDKIAYFMIFDLNQGLQHTKSIKFQQLSWINQNYSIIKPLQNTMQFAIFKQTQQQQNEWILKLITIQNDNEAKIIDLRDILTQKHTMMDVIAKSKDQYYIFINHNTDNYNKIDVRSCILLQQHKEFTASWSILYKIDLFNSNMCQIIHYDTQKDIFLTRNYCFQPIKDETYTNIIQVRKLSNGKCMSRLPCNLKQSDFNIKHTLIVDYSQQLEASDKIIMHVRTIFTKKTIFAYLLENNQVLDREKFNDSFREMILSLL